jgi:AhpD family alkylhydroperoxidase
LKKGLAAHASEEVGMLIQRDLMEKFFDFETVAVAKPGSLDVKTKELIAVGCSIMADCLPCFDHHYRMAVQNGATVEEVKEAIAIAIAISAGNKIAKFSLKAAELFKEDL